MAWVFKSSKQIAPKREPTTVEFILPCPGSLPWHCQWYQGKFGNVQVMGLGTVGSRHYKPWRTFGRRALIWRCRFTNASFSPFSLLRLKMDIVMFKCGLRLCNYCFNQIKCFISNVCALFWAFLCIQLGTSFRILACFISFMRTCSLCNNFRM